MKRALILGVTGGLGSALAQRLIAAGYETVGTARERTVPPQKGPKGPGLISIHLDLDVAASREAFIADARAHGPYDICIDAIGRQLELKRFTSTPLEAFAQANEDTLGHVACIQGILPFMAQGAALVFVLSEMLERNAGFAAPYVMGKHGLLGLVKSLAAEYPAEKLAVFGVSPGMLDTALTAAVPRIAKERYAQEHGRAALLTPAETADRIIILTQSENRRGHHGTNVFII